MFLSTTKQFFVSSTRCSVSNTRVYVLKLDVVWSRNELMTFTIGLKKEIIATQKIFLSFMLVCLGLCPLVIQLKHTKLWETVHTDVNLLSIKV